MPPNKNFNDFEIDLSSKDMQFILDPAKNPILKQMVENGDVSFLSSTLQKYVGMPNTPATRNDMADALSQSLYSINSGPRSGKTFGLQQALQEQFKNKNMLSTYRDDIRTLEEVYKTMPDKVEKTLTATPKNKIEYCDGLLFLAVDDEFHKGLGKDINFVDLFVIKTVSFSLTGNKVQSTGFAGETFAFENLRNGDIKHLVNLHYQKFKPLWFQVSDVFDKISDGENVIIKSIVFMEHSKEYIVNFVTNFGTVGSKSLLEFISDYELS